MYEKKIDRANILHCTKTRNLSANQVNEDYWQDGIQFTDNEVNVKTVNINLSGIRLSKM